MAEAIELKATPRERRGKGGPRTLRREGRVPGIVYGDGREPESISVDYKTLYLQHQTGHFLSTIFMLDVDGKKTRVIPRDVQVDPVRDFPIHVDFMRISKDAEVTVDVPVHVVNEATSPGLKRGGVLNLVRHEIELRCKADSIPEQIEIDLAGLDIGDAVHISDIKLPAGARPVITDRDFTVLTIAGRTEEEPETEGEEGEGEEAAEGGAEDKE